MHINVCLQHYTKDADGLCTRLLKPKLMEGTVAAQDAFSRSQCLFEGGREGGGGGVLPFVYDIFIILFIIHFYFLSSYSFW